MVIDKTPAREPTNARPASHRTDSASGNVHKSSPPFESNQPLPSKYARDSIRVQAPTNEPMPRASSRTSTVPASPRKAVPPVPKKPASLSESNGQRVSQDSSNFATDRTVSATRPSVLRRAPSNNPKAGFPPPPPPQRITKIPSRPSQQNQQLSAPANGPPLPTRRTNTAVQSTNGLMDDDNDGASSIPSLKPTRRS